MITFIVTNTGIKSRAHALPQVLLIPDGWNDWWKFKTLYSVALIDQDGNRHSLGGIKIGQMNMADNQARANLPLVFTNLNADFFSLGQDVEYYEKIKKFGDDIRENIHSALNDIAFDNEIFENVKNERVTSNSLLRSVSISSIKGQFKRLAKGDATLTNFAFSYTSPVTRGISPITLEFSVNPKSNPPTNVHVIIGRNGVGKTHLINNMIQSLIKDSSSKNGQFSSLLEDSWSPIFANLVSVSFSAFDETELISEKRNKLEGIAYSYIGLRSESKKAPGVIITKSPIKLKNEYARSAYLCKIGGKINRLKEAIDSLESDAIFNDAELSSSFMLEDQKDFESDAAGKFDRLSSGHKIVLLTITRLVQTLEEKSLILIDEPEAHLHPPLLSAFVRTLSKLLIRRNAVAIIATHSPVILQEVPRSCCWKLRRAGRNAVAERLEIESFGENVGTLTQEIFGLEVTHAGFHKLLRKAAQASESYEDLIETFDNQLGLEAKALARAIISNKEG